ncbi:MAG TPA: PDZ domain-containing protein [Thermoanaerobaculia bacterium]|jgi:S1-C subfamily serine protease
MMHTTLLILFLAARAAHPGWIGLGYTYHRPDPGKPGWLHVQRLAPRGPAESAGLRPQDVITAIDGKPLRFAKDEEVLSFFGSLKVHQQLTFTVVRQQKTLTIKVKAVSLPPEYLPLWKKNAELAKQRAKQ